MTSKYFTNITNTLDVKSSRHMEKCTKLLRTEIDGTHEYKTQATKIKRKQEKQSRSLNFFRFGEVFTMSDVPEGKPGRMDEQLLIVRAGNYIYLNLELMNQ